jgi:DNA mismatch repair protein MSH5
LTKYIEAVLSIAKILETVESDRILDNHFENHEIRVCREMLNVLVAQIDFEESKEQDRIVFQQHINPQLDALKRLYNGLDEFLSNFADRIELPENSATCFKLVYFPQLGFLIALEFKDPSMPECIAGMELQFSASGVSYYKSDSMRGLQ